MPIGGHFVLDAVTHAFDARAENVVTPYGAQLLESLYLSQAQLAPPGYALSRNRFFQARGADALASALFLESATDVAVYHSIPAWGMLRDLSPISVAMDIRERYPGRMFLYGAVSPLQGTDALEALLHQASTWDIIGVKFYPLDVIDGELRTLRMSDTKYMYPILEKCLELGISNVAIHKSLPIGTAPLDAFHPGDVDYAAADFPNLNFEIVHGGYAFLEETVFQLSRFPNIFVNLEATGALLLKRPQHFAHILGQLLLAGGSTKIYWGTGGVPHPAPIMNAFATYQFSDELRDQFGYPELTDDIKANIFGKNYARTHGLNIDELAQAIEGDALATKRAQGEPSPWHLIKEPDEPDPLAIAHE
jgi:predicted TIM-barrel fold metal-dependent hydrolase